MIEAASIVRIVKMEDRKRASDHDESAAPPPKRQATMTNGEGDKSDVSRLGAVTSPWQVELDVRSFSLFSSYPHVFYADPSAQSYQKDALIRQMRELKRDKVQLESQLADVEKRAKYHDEHLRIIDAWLIQVSRVLILSLTTFTNRFRQLVDSMKVLVGDVKSIQPMDTGMTLPYPSPYSLLRT
jgi:E3 ubiquitin-protein ligase BRE1